MRETRHAGADVYDVNAVVIERPRRSLRDILSVVFRRKRLVAGSALAALVLACAWIVITPETFRSEAKVLLRVGRETVSMDPSIMGPTIAVAQRRESEINSEVSLLRGRVLAERVVGELGPERVLPPRKEAAAELRAHMAGLLDRARSLVGLASQESDAVELGVREEAVQSLQDRLYVHAEDQSYLIGVRYEAESPSTARATLNSLLDHYLRYHVQVHEASASPEFFAEQEKVLAARLADRERILDEYRETHGVASLPRQKEILLDSVSTLRASLGAVQADIDSSRAKIKALKAALSGKSREVVLSRADGKPNQAADRLKERLVDLRLREADLAARFTDAYQPLRDVRSQIALAEAELSREMNKTEIVRGIDPNFQALQLSLEMETGELDASLARADAMRREQERLDAELSQLVAAEAEYEGLERSVALLREDYGKFHEQMQRATISSAMDRDLVSNVRVVEPATLPLEPVRPLVAATLAGSLLLGLVLGLLAAFVADHFDDTMHTAGDVERMLALPVLASVTREEYEGCS